MLTFEIEKGYRIARKSVFMGGEMVMMMMLTWERYEAAVLASELAAALYRPRKGTNEQDII